MPLTRTELIARGFALADRETQGEVPLVSLLENSHIGSLSPEEKVEVVNRYSELTKDRVHGGPSLWSSLKNYTGSGMLTSLPVALTAGALTAPGLTEIKNIHSAVGGNALSTAGKVVGKMAVPIGLTLGLGAITGATVGMIKHHRDAQQNRYLAKVLEGIGHENDPEKRQVASMALLAMSPSLKAGYVGNEAHAQGMLDKGLEMQISPDRYRQMITSNPVNIPRPLLDEEGKPILHHITGTRHMAPADEPIDFDYKDWSWVPGASKDTHDIVHPNMAKKIREYAAQGRAEKAHNSKANAEADVLAERIRKQFNQGNP